MNQSQVNLNPPHVSKETLDEFLPTVAYMQNGIIFKHINDRYKHFAAKHDARTCNAISREFRISTLENE